MGNPLTIYSALEKKSFAVEIFDGKGSHKLNSGQRFKCVNSQSFADYNSVFVYCCIMTPMGNREDGAKVFFIKEDTQTPMYMRLSEWINSFKAGSFVLIDGVPQQPSYSQIAGHDRYED